MAERPWEDMAKVDGAANVVVVTGSVVLVLDGGSARGLPRFSLVVGVGARCVFSSAGAESGLSPFEGLGTPAAFGLTRCPPPTPARRAAMTAPTSPNDARGVRMRDRRDRVRACFGAGLASCLRGCLARCTREVDGRAGWGAVASISSKPMCSLILRPGVMNSDTVPSTSSLPDPEDGALPPERVHCPETPVRHRCFTPGRPSGWKGPDTN